MARQKYVNKVVEFLQQQDVGIMRALDLVGKLNEIEFFEGTTTQEMGNVLSKRPDVVEMVPVSRDKVLLYGQYLACSWKLVEQTPEHTSNDPYSGLDWKDYWSPK